MKTQKNRTLLAFTAIVSGLLLFVAVTKHLNAGQGYYGGYNKYGYGTGYPRPVAPAYPFYPPGVPPVMRGYNWAPGYNWVPGYGPSPQVQANSNESAPAAKNVTIAAMQFQPATIRVNAGDEVTWINNAAMPHTVTGREDGKLSSERLNQGSVFRHTFEKPGTYLYYCALHPSMTGVVVVE